MLNLTVFPFLQRGGTQKTKKLLATFNDPALLKLWEQEGTPRVKIKNKTVRPSYGILTGKIKLGKIDPEIISRIDNHIKQLESQLLKLDPSSKEYHEIEEEIRYSKHYKDSYQETLNNGHPFNKDEFLSELAHSSQLKDKGALKRFGTFMKNLKEKSTLGERAYDVPGTVEYEAHKEIEPRLKAYYNTLGLPQLVHKHKKGRKLKRYDQLLPRYVQLTAR